MLGFTRWLNKIYKKLETKEPALLYVFLEITRRCNLNCMHCGSDCLAESKSPEITIDSWQKIAEYLSSQFGRELTFVITGGEPLVHLGLEALGKTITDLGNRWGMVTNALALTEKRFESLRNAGLFSITVSVDGTDAAHNHLRNRPGLLEKITPALKMIGKADLMFKDAVTCVYPKNVNELDRIAEFLLDCGITSWRLFRIFPKGRAYRNAELQLSFKQTQAMLDWIQTNKPVYARKGLTMNYSCEGYMPYTLDRRVRDHPFFCRAGINIASILSDGTITGCSNNAEYFAEGNILRDDFRNVWENRFEKFRKREWAKTGICADCSEFTECHGSSIHLWETPEEGIRFCYIKDIEKKSI